MDLGILEPRGIVTGGQVSLASILVEVVVATIIIGIILNVRQQNIICLQWGLCWLDSARCSITFFLHPLKSVPGPLIAKVLPQYMQLAVLKGMRCHVSWGLGWSLKCLINFDATARCSCSFMRSMGRSYGLVLTKYRFPIISFIERYTTTLPVSRKTRSTPQLGQHRPLKIYSAWGFGPLLRNCSYN